MAEVNAEIEIEEEGHICADGVENSEHVLDILQEIDMLKGNINDNTDLAIKVYKLQKKDKSLSDDILDAIQLSCEKIIECEKAANQLTEAQTQIEMKDEKGFKEILNKMRELEESSRKMLERILR